MSAPEAFFPRDQLQDTTDPGASAGKKRRRPRRNTVSGTAPNSEDQKHQRSEEEEAEGHQQQQAARDEEREALFCQARSLCATKGEWSRCQGLGADELRDFVQEKTFQNYQALTQGLVRAVHVGLAQLMDKLSKGDNFVAEEITNDLTLAMAIHEETNVLAKLINNKVRIALLLAMDTFQGKKRQRLEGPVVREEPQEEKTATLPPQ